MLASKLMMAGGESPLVLVFDTSLGDTTIELPLNGTVNAEVDWGDGTSDTYTTAGTQTHTYSSGGEYVVKVYGLVTSFGSGDLALSRPELTKCLSFGDLGITSLSGAFRDCANFIEAPSKLPAGVIYLNQTFLNATSFNHYIGDWDTSNVTEMFKTFQNAVLFNQYIGDWDTSSVVITFDMFNGASAFNQNIGSWDTSNITGPFISQMFFNASAFNQDLTGWCVGNVNSEPANFSTFSALTAGNKPVWGTCPSYIADGSITYIGQATGVDSATLPAHQAGDLILAFAFRDGPTGSLPLPTGWTTIRENFGTLCASRTGFKVAASSGETTGTWTNATTVIFLVYRGVNTANITGLGRTASGSSTTVTYSGNSFWQGLSRLVAFAGHRSTDTALETPPGTLNLIVGVVDATDEAAAFESAADNFGNWTSTNVAVGGTSSGWLTTTLRLRVPIKLGP